MYWDNYPLGAANDPRAPWGQEAAPQDVNVVVSQTLSRPTTLKVSDYKIDVDIYDFSDTDFKKAYEKQEYDISELLIVLQTYLKNDIQSCLEESKKKRLELILKCSENWVVDELEIIKDS